MNYSQKEFLNIMERYNTMNRKIIKSNLVKIYKTYGFKNQDIRRDLDLGKAKVDSWTTMSMTNIPTFYDALRMAVQYNFDIAELIAGGELPKPFNVFTMGFYGNRTVVPCYKDGDINKILSGWLDEELMNKMAEPIDRQFVKIPNSDCYVLYDGNMKVDEHTKVVFSIPEQNVNIYGRCVICRYENDEIKGIEDNDYETFSKYIVD